jgi:hypothetical protein
MGVDGLMFVTAGLRCCGRRRIRAAPAVSPAVDRSSSTRASAAHPPVTLKLRSIQSSAAAPSSFLAPLLHRLVSMMYAQRMMEPPTAACLPCERQIDLLWSVPSSRRSRQSRRRRPESHKYVLLVLIISILCCACTTKN